jgi:hypothetical protein
MDHYPLQVTAAVSMMVGVLIGGFAQAYAKPGADQRPACMGFSRQFLQCIKDGGEIDHDHGGACMLPEPTQEARTPGASP